MSRHCVVVLVVCLLSLILSASSLGLVIVDDAFGNAVFLPSHSTIAHLGYSLTNPQVDLSPYTLTVHCPAPTARFHVNDAFGQAVLSTAESSALGTVEAPNAVVGEYVYRFVIPSTGRLLFNMSYSSTGFDEVQVLISVSNPLGPA